MAGTQECTHVCVCTRVHAHTRTHGRPQVSLGLLAPCSHPQGLDSVAGERCTQIAEVGRGRVKGLPMTGTGTGVGQGQKRLYRAEAKFRNAAGGAAGALAGHAWAGNSARAHSKLAPSPAHTLFRRLGNTASEIPTIPSSPVAQPISLVKGISTAGHSEGAEPRWCKN